VPKFLINLANEEKERKEGREDIRRETISSSTVSSPKQLVKQ